MNQPIVVFLRFALPLLGLALSSAVTGAASDQDLPFPIEHLEKEWRLLEGFMNSNHKEFARGFDVLIVEGEVVQRSRRRFTLRCAERIQCVLTEMPKKEAAAIKAGCSVRAIGMVEHVDYEEKRVVLGINTIVGRLLEVRCL